ncbi:MAG: hypothetical protein M1828_006457 [Chrysothrix sp. TS-e1954]|nr:MAG: hypothetical protein M1828_006457 [Chrysothrix sp. TS-e1954]
MASPTSKTTGAPTLSYPLTPIASGSIPSKKTTDGSDDAMLLTFDLPPSAIDLPQAPKAASLRERDASTVCNDVIAQQQEQQQQQPSPPSHDTSAKGSPNLKRKAPPAPSLADASASPPSAPPPPSSRPRPCKSAKVAKKAPPSTTSTAPTTTAKKPAKPSSTKKTARKTAHSIIERRRRIRMNEEFEILKSLVPGCEGVEMHKLEILRSAVGWVRELMGRTREGSDSVMDLDDDDDDEGEDASSDKAAEEELSEGSKPPTVHQNPTTQSPNQATTSIPSPRYTTLQAPTAPPATSTSTSPTFSPPTPTRPTTTSLTTSPLLLSQIPSHSSASASTSSDADEAGAALVMLRSQTGGDAHRRQGSGSSNLAADGSFGSSNPASSARFGSASTRVESTTSASLPRASAAPARGQNRGISVSDLLR